MAHGVGFYNMSWRDMGVPTLDKMMDIVQVGRGRPGLSRSGQSIWEAARSCWCLAAVIRCDDG
jgi:hypothetical protein